MTPRTAGVISSHNQLRFIEESARSLATEVDELVVIDDGSQDGSYDVLRRLEQEGVLRLLRNEIAQGVSEAYNAAIATIDADILLIQGGDDRTLPGRAAASIAALEEEHAALAFSLPIVIDEHGRELPADVAGEFAAGAVVDDPIRYLFGTGNYICAPSVALRVADYRRHGGFPPGIDLLQDYALWLELAAYGRFVRIPEPVVAYRKHAMNLSREYVGIDTLRRRRHAAEMEWIKDGFLARADASTLRRVVGLPDAAPDGSGPFDRDELAMLVRLAQSDRRMTRRGLSELFDRVARDGIAVLARYGMQRQTLDDLAVRADHDNLEELGRARAAVAALRGLGTIGVHAEGGAGADVTLGE